MKSAKLIGINIAVLIGLVIIIFGGGKAYKKSKRLADVFFAYLGRSQPDERVKLKALQDSEDADEIFKEMKMLGVVHEPFLIYERPAFKGNYFNILPKFRNRSSSGSDVNNSVWFFGGSTVFGSGVSDTQTIPSHFHKYSKLKVANFGVDGWDTRQSLNKLINLLSNPDLNPRAIVFYYGVNDVQGSCLSITGEERRHARSHVMNVKMGESIMVYNLVNKLIAPHNIYTPWHKTISTTNKFDCDSNDLKRQTISRSVAQEIYSAYSLARVKSGSIKFFAVLQPSLYTSVSDTKDIKTNSLLKKQYSVMYTAIKKELEILCNQNNAFCDSIVDGSSWIRVKDPVYFDEAHLNSRGNKIVARNIFNLFK